MFFEHNIIHQRPVHRIFRERYIAFALLKMAFDESDPNLLVSSIELSRLYLKIFLSELLATIMATGL